MKYKVSVIKKIAFLVMTMALAVAMVACSAAAGKPGPPGEPGPAGPAGPPAETTDPTDPTDPPTTGPMPVQIVKQIGPLPFVFNDDDDDEMDTESRMLMLAGTYIYPSTDVMYELDTPSSMVSDRVDAMVDESTGTLTVMLKEGAKWELNELKVTASNDISSIELPFTVRRNRPPMVSMVYGTPKTERTSIPNVWVGTMEPKELAITTDCEILDVGKKCIPVHIGASAPDAADDVVATSPFFHDDAGDKLELVTERLSTSDAKLLMVEDGSKVTLMGKKTAGQTADGGVGSDAGVEVSFRAVDANGMESEDAVKVLMVKVDEAPTVVKAIGTHSIKLRAATSPRFVTIVNKADYFTDDRDSTVLTYSAMSDTPEVALISMDGTGTGALVGKKEFKDIEGANLYIVGINPGTAMITVKATEAEATTPDVKPQSTTETFKVVVELE